LFLTVAVDHAVRRFFCLSLSPDRKTTIFDIGGMSSLSSIQIAPETNNDACRNG
jgi:hypothetical protein